MYLRSIALKNIARRKGKTVLVVAGLAIGIAALVAIITTMLAFQKNVDEKLDTYGFNVVIQPASSNISLSYGGMTISGVDTYEVQSLTGKDVPRIEGIPSADKIAAISPKLLQVAEVKGKKVLLVGTDFDRELSVKKWWALHGKKPSAPDGLIVGIDAARSLGLKIGDPVEVAGSKFKVAAVLQSTGSQDDGLIFADLATVQSLFGRDGELSLIEVSAKNSVDIDSVVADLEKALPQASVSSIKQAVKYKEEAMGSLVNFGLVVSAIIIVISGLIVFTTMTSSVSDRRREIGIFRAIGYRQSVVARIILIEALVLSLIGGAAGYIVGFGLVYLLPVLVDKIELLVRPNALVLILSIGLSVLVGLFASLLPAKKAACMDPADALKSL